jgi:serine protease
MPSGPSSAKRARAVAVTNWACSLALTLPLLAGAQGSASTEAASDRAARGLIVKLRNAPAHESALRRKFAAAADTQALADEPLRRVLRSAGIMDARWRAVGRASQHLDFGRVLSGAEAAALAQRLRARPEVEWVVPNERERRSQVVPNDTLFPATGSSAGQWWLQPVGGSNANGLERRLRGVPGIQSAWALDPGSPAVPVAVLDTGITRHPDLNGRVLGGYDFVATPEFAGDADGRDADPSDPGDFVSQADKSANPALFADCVVEDSSWHGTDIAGILAAATNNAEGGAGINWHGQVVPVRVAGKCGAEVADIVDGMLWAAGLPVPNGAGGFVPPNPNPVRVVNISFGGNAACNPAYQDAIDALAARGVVVVAAAGNEHASVSRPANCRGVIAVAALNRDGFKTTYSNFGRAVTVSTVGGDSSQEGAWGPRLGDDGMLTLDNHGTQAPGTAGYSRIFGTSFAAPVVAGVVGLMLSANPDLSATQIIDGLRLSARPHVSAPKIGACSVQNPGRCICNTATCGAGILDAEQALRYALDPAGYVNPNRRGAVLDNADIDAAVALGPDLPADALAPPAAAASGGGALGGGWLLALAGAVFVLARARPLRPA